MIRQILATTMILALTLAVVGRTDILAASTPNPALQSSSAQSVSFETDVPGMAEAAAVLRSVSAKAGCKGHFHRVAGACSSDALNLSAEAVPPSQSIHAVTWLDGSEHFNRTALDPGFRPPISAT